MHNGSAVSSKNIFFDIIRDHLDLVTDEWRYEKKQAIRRLRAVAVGLALLVSAFVLVQVAAIHGLMRLGCSFLVSCLSLGAVYAIWGVLILLRYGRPEQRVSNGAPKRVLHSSLRT